MYVLHIIFSLSDLATRARVNVRVGPTTTQKQNKNFPAYARFRQLSKYKLTTWLNFITHTVTTSTFGACVCISILHSIEVIWSELKSYDQSCHLVLSKPYTYKHQLHCNFHGGKDALLFGLLFRILQLRFIRSTRLRIVYMCCFYLNVLKYKPMKRSIIFRVQLWQW